MEVYSRSYLQGMQAERRRQAIDQMVTGFIHSVIIAAGRGETSYKYSITSAMNKDKYIIGLLQFSIDELIAGLQVKFPECQISYNECLDEYKNLIKAIVIDWS
jgi:hypothetical protein